MVQKFADGKFIWIDVVAPTAEEIQALANEYNIHEQLVRDVLEADHLPKYEAVGDTSFYILRYYCPDERPNIDTIQGLTNKLAIFHTDKGIITIHRFEIDFILDLKKNLIDSGECKGIVHFLNKLIKSVFHSFESPALEMANAIDDFESKVFLKKNTPSLKKIYYTKRKIEVCARVLLLSKDILERVDNPSQPDPDTRDTRDLYVRILTLFESMAENTNHLLTLYFSVSSQRTNDVIRVLTLFSVFFMPLTFIVGIYGMNFDNMPELHWRYGYPAIVLSMLIVSLVIYLWFRRKGWI